MSGFEYIEDFEVAGALGRCKVCNPPGQGQWARLANLRDHERNKTHQQNRSRKLRVARDVSSASDDHPPSPVPTRPPENVPRNTVFPSHDWLPVSFEDDPVEDGSRTGDVDEREKKIRLAMENALAGRLSFTAGEPDSLPGGKDSELSMEDVLAGAGLLRAALYPADEAEETPDALNAESESTGGDWDDMGDGRKDPNDLSEHFFGAHKGTRESYFPYPNKAMMKTDILFSSPELRFSRAQKEAILAWGRALGAKDVPSLYKLEKFQAEALEAYGNPTKRVQTSSGHVFYQNSLHHHVATQYAHPEVRQHIKAYPVFNHGRVSEAFHSTKWLVDAPPDLATPMVRIGHQDFYVNELTYCEGDVWCIPLRFFEFEGNGMWAKDLGNDSD
ncbi:hypothetical protein BD310DRAFT_973250 [Dichomitus squalens]|uniref:Uncharacterized protein n=1 Tax=Dichomitus squalens TaxID=114155 RepID=A0A4Q9Q9F2_9APHY|nr:hypothetical protein BD310DRAFT_973250 [Dichomitus squalens]